MRKELLSLADQSDVGCWLEAQQDGLEVRLVLQNETGQKNHLQPWRRCIIPDCWGASFHGRRECFVHLEETEAMLAVRQSALNTRFDLSGTVVTERDWDRVLRIDREYPGKVIDVIRLNGARFAAPLYLTDRTFREPFDPQGTVFERAVTLKRCSFEKPLVLQFVTSHQNIAITDADLRASVSLSRSEMKEVDFSGAVIKAEFFATLKSKGARLVLNRARVLGEVSVKECHVSLEHAEVSGRLSIDSNHRGLNAQGIHVNRSGVIGKLPAGTINFRRARFDSHVSLRFDRQDVILSDAHFAHGGNLSFVQGSMHLDGMVCGGRLRIDGDSQFAAPVIYNLRGADLTGVSFSHVDVRQCRFDGVHGLASAEFDSLVVFERVNSSFGSRRVVLDETEQSLIARPQTIVETLRSMGRTLTYGPPLRSGVGQGSGPSAFAKGYAIYREMRRGYEARSDMTGASEFYFGEMEMRANDPNRSAGERVLLKAYRAVSGYGTNPWRAVVCLFGVGLLSVVALAMTTAGRVELSDIAMAVAQGVLPGYSYPKWATGVTAWVILVVRVAILVVVALALFATKTVVMRKPSE